jgi:hypothetical protein
LQNVRHCRKLAIGMQHICVLSLSFQKRVIPARVVVEADE